MSTATLEQPVALTGRALFDQQTKDFGSPPTGKVWKRSGKGETAKYALDKDGKPIPVDRPTRHKKGKDEFAIPHAGRKYPVFVDPADPTKRVPVVTPGFVVGVHGKLKQSNFSDPLDYCEWNVWYCEQVLERAKTELSDVKTLGATPEERNANITFGRATTTVRNIVQAGKATGKNKAQIEMLQKLLADLMVDA